MTIDPSISYGTIITLVVSIASVVAAYMLFVIRQDKHLAILTYRVEGLTEAITGVEKLLRIQIEQNTRIGQLEKLVDELRHGEGYVLPLGGRNKTAFGNG